MSYMRHTTSTTNVATLTMRLHRETRDLLEFIKARDGIPFAEQLRRAMRLYAKARNIKRGGTHAA